MTDIGLSAWVLDHEHIQRLFLIPSTNCFPKLRSGVKDPSDRQIFLDWQILTKTVYNVGVQRFLMYYFNTTAR